MLPLWIIDITTNRERREPLVALLQQVEHVHISKDFAVSKLSKLYSEPETNGQDPAAGAEVDTVSLLNRVEVTEDLSNSLSQQELLDQLERRAAEKDAIIKGDYWFYSAFDDVFRGVEIKSEELDKKGNVAERLYALQSKIVEAGVQFIHQLPYTSRDVYLWRSVYTM